MSRRAYLTVLTACLALNPLVTASAATALGDGDSVEITLAPGEVNNDFYVEVPEGTTQMEIALDARRPNAEDVDLFARFGEAFGGQASPFSEALYYSAGETGEELLDITFASSPPVSPGRWYLSVVNAGTELTSRSTLSVGLRSEAEPTLRPLEIQVIYTDGPNAGFNDNSPFQGQGGNNASTLGQARRRAFERAIEILEASFSSPVPIIMEAGFDQKDANGDEKCPDALACAGPNFIDFGFPGAQDQGIWYPSSTIPRLAGTSSCRLYGDVNCNSPVADVSISFNKESDFEQGGWWYGFQRSFFENQEYDFIAVAVHEMLHGLGYLSLINTGFNDNAPDGAFLNGRPDVFATQLVYQNGGEFTPLTELNNQQRAEAITSVGNLMWGGPAGSVFWQGFGSFDPKPVMYAPRELNPGSSVSHTAFNDIMFFQGNFPSSNRELEIRTGGPELGSAWYFLRDAGWDEEPKDQLQGPAMPAVQRGMWYDRARNGHGFDFQRAGDMWFLVFFTYDDAGNPEWYLAVGTLEGGVFSADLIRYTYDPSDPDGDGGPLDAGTVVGTVVLELGATQASPACDDGVDRDDAAALARFSWEIDGEQGDWCAEPLQFAGSQPSPDFTGHWYAGNADPGWGMTIYQRQADDGSQILVDTLYFFDDAGNPRWAQGVETDFINDHGEQSIGMFQFQGYPRTRDCTPEICELGAGAGASAGSLRLRLKEPIQGENPGSRATTNVDYLGPEGGNWQRNFVDIEMLSDPS